jgi:dienelactone hydrolase
MLQLSPDSTFHYELLRILGSARDLGADVAEVLGVASRIVPGDFESWFAQFDALGKRVQAQAKAQAACGRSVSARNAYLRAASYFRAADFFLHGNPDDPRIRSIWNEARACFDAALGALEFRAERITIHAQGFKIPAVFYRAAGDQRARPTLLMCNGYDGSQEEMLHVSGLAACARGFNVVTFEGPGQPTVIREQGLTFIDSWEEVVTPVIDWCETQPAIDASRIGLLGYSFGGWLVTRAAVHEHRIRAVACVDGILDAADAFLGALPPELRAIFHAGNAAAIDAAVGRMMAVNTNVRWAVEHGCWVYGCATPYAFLKRAQSMVLSDRVATIRCPVLVCDADEDAFFKGQPAALAQALGARATHVVFTGEDCASAHCHVGASDLMNSTVLGWFTDRLSSSHALLPEHQEMVAAAAAA